MNNRWRQDHWMLDLNLCPGIAWSAGTIADKQGRLFDIEEKTVASAVKKRRSEFRAGRTCAREALKLLGCAEVAIPVHPDRNPIWPDGFTGSITHSSSLAASIVARRDVFSSLGIDLEEDSPLESDLQSMILRPDERLSLSSTTMINSQSTDTAKMVFVIKEAVFKAVFPILRARFEFQDVSVTIDAKSERYTAELHLPIPINFDRIVEGSIAHDVDHIIATATIPATSSIKAPAS